MFKVVVLFNPDENENVLLVKWNGKSPATINNFVMDGQEAYEAKNGDILEFVQNTDYKYEVTFLDETGASSKRRNEDTNVGAAVKKQKTSDENKWEMIDEGKCYAFTSKDVNASSKIASYDLDGTLIRTMSGNVFPKNIDDWQINYKVITKKLKSLHENGFKIVIFSNQAGIAAKKMTVSDLKKKIGMIQTRLDVPLQAFFATGPTKYRKPRIGMWNILKEFNDEIEVDIASSFYVGDAAGRPEIKGLIKRKKDHSSADRLFAINVGLDFFTPEEHFLKEKKSSWTKPEFIPNTISDNIPLLEPQNAKLTSNEQEIIMMVGFPASGKSFFCERHLKSNGYEVINRDTLNSMQKCFQNVEHAIKEKKSCVIDNTNPDIASRKKFIEVAQKLKVPIRCFLMNTSYHQSKHNNIFRELTNNAHQKISDMVFNIFKKNYVEPTKKEGFTEIVRVNVLPIFDDPNHDKLYKMFLLEK